MDREFNVDHSKGERFEPRTAPQAPGREPEPHVKRPGTGDHAFALDAAGRQCDVAFKKVEIDIRKAYLPFSTAYKIFTDTLARQAQIHHIRQQIMLDVVFTALGGFLGGIVQQALRTALTRAAAGAQAAAPATKPAQLNQPMTSGTTTLGSPQPAPKAARPGEPLTVVGAGTAGGDLTKMVTKLGTMLTIGSGRLSAGDAGAEFSPENWLQSAQIALGTMQVEVGELLLDIGKSAKDGAPLDPDPTAIVEQFFAQVRGFAPQERSKEELQVGLFEAWTEEEWLNEVRTEPELQMVLDHDSHVRQKIESLPGGKEMLARKIAAVRAKIAGHPYRPPLPSPGGPTKMAPDTHPDDRTAL